jgi:HYR domain
VCQAATSRRRGDRRLGLAARSEITRLVTGNVHLSLPPTAAWKPRIRAVLATLALAAVAAIATPGAGAVAAAEAEPPTFVDVIPVVVVNVNGVQDAVVDYALPVAQDAAGSLLPVLCDPAPGSTFPLGDTDVNCIATDADGAQVSVSFVVRVSDSVPPPPPTDVIVRGDTASVKLRWRLPADRDIAGTEIVRYPGAFVVFHGTGTSFTDTDIKAGGSYRYLISSYDWADNRARPIPVHTSAAKAKLAEPQDWAQLTQPPLLAWAPVSAADYYNVQLWAIGKGASRKVLSIWPTSTRVQLASRWAFGGKKYALAPGRYRWYVWPGLGQLSDGRYGDLIGSHVFVVVK